jgi:integrase
VAERSPAMPAYKIKRKNVLHLEEVLGLIKETNDERMKCLIALAYTFGSRITEMLRLKRDDFRIQGDRLQADFILEKKKANENMPMLPTWTREIATTYPLVTFIWTYVEKVPRGEFIFKSSHSASGHLTRIWAHENLKVLDSNLCWHFFRRSVITNVVHETKNMMAGKQIAGHATVKTTEIYVENDPSINELLAVRNY